MLKLNGLVRARCSSVWIFALLSLGALTVHAATATFEIEPQDLSGALKAFAIQSHREIFFTPELARGRISHGVKGKFDDLKALSIILEGTGLNFSVTTSNAILVRGPSGKAESSRDAVTPVTSSGAPSTRASSQIVPEDSSSGSIETHGNSDLDEITVTGTHIRGTKDSPSPVLVFTRDDIDAAGVNTIQQFLQSLPQNFGGASENTIGAIASNGQTNNTVNGSAPNLRGLGASATLVLINGHRVAPGNSDGSFVDISMIPLTAVERIEIVTAGSSAIYGSDAVGGVVNIILRTKFDGAETRVQYGSVTDGSSHNVQVGQTVGTDWTGGSGVLSYQYFDQTPLSAASRDYLHSVPLPFDLLPVEVKRSVFANADQEVAPGFNIHGDAIYSHRGTNTAFSYDNDSTYITAADPSKIDFYCMSLGSTVKLPRQSELTVTATYSESDTAQQYYETGESSSPFEIIKTKAAIISVDANLDGVLFSLPAGPVRYAVGAQYRKESFGNTFILPVTDNTF